MLAYLKGVDCNFEASCIRSINVEKAAVVIKVRLRVVRTLKDSTI